MNPIYNQDFSYVQPKNVIPPRPDLDAEALEQRKPFVLNPPEKSDKTKDDMKKLKERSKDDKDKDKNKKGNKQQ